LKDIFNLKNKIALVTGGCSGIGKVVAEALNDFNEKVVVGDINVDKEKRIKEKEILYVKSDITKLDDVKKLVYEVKKKFNRIDLLVNCAGVAKRIPVEVMSEKDWDMIINVNLKGTFLVNQIVGREMIKQKKGNIINIASISGITCNKGLNWLSAYCASKAGVILFSKELSIEWVKYNIRVNCISPGYMKTPMTYKTRTNPDQTVYKELIDSVPMRRYGDPKELIGAIIFLASDASSYVTGANLIVDGGYTSW